MLKDTEQSTQQEASRNTGLDFIKQQIDKAFALYEPKTVPKPLPEKPPIMFMHNPDFVQGATQEELDKAYDLNAKRHKRNRWT
ncbi:hypothetical protein LZS94_05175 [Aliivibrio fischeri]|uniref:hypothetical protein n=1 Tax=Aliivibrio fischeri TaxID=668 RepID=UPI001F2EDF9E|nr:hypothetical protein [Aliivibrio fischeri]MCE7576881.1 hypothetical protein [Aliivibrio fischeri]MCE7588997.1 hypothetical protein [Aliivibrio fischeri]